MTKDNLVLEYSITVFLPPNETRIRLFEDGKVEVVGYGTKFMTEEVLKRLQLSPQQIQSYAQRLVENGFFDYTPSRGYVLDGLVETITLNYQGREGTIKSGNRTSPSLFPDIVRELKDLVEQYE
jgi:hypothetical protein